jgi:hypothetical protein
MDMNDRKREERRRLTRNRNEYLNSKPGRAEYEGQEE